MFWRLLLAFTLIPLAEIWLLIKVGSLIGAFPTIVIVAITGFAGASLARSEGLATITRIRAELSSGNMPTASLLDGALILAGGVLLLTPGLVTDTAGLLLLIPVTRALLGSYISRRLQDWLYGRLR